jgi:hypothetical protein
MLGFKEKQMNINKYLTQQLAAIARLTEEHPAHSFSVLILVYCGIDQFSWLNTDKEKHGFAEFKEWVEKYIFLHHQLNCNAEELWAARNALVHMGTTESSNNRNNGVQKLGYSYGPKTQQSQVSDHKIVSIELLVQAFIEGAMFFIADLGADAGKLAVAEEKLEKLLFVQ